MRRCRVPRGYTQRPEPPFLRVAATGKKKEQPEQSARTYYREKGISEEAQREIVSILMREKKRNAVNEKP